ncbi:MAG: flippase [Ruminococcaceae bacterium]|nr:flippase [Oscillospiraceae bacterium]
MIKKILKSKVFSNGVYLYILQMFNTIIPLLTLPYITYILGDSQYGVFSKILNYVTYFQAVVEYGFTLAGARKISLCNTEEERNKIFSSITYSKILLAAVSALGITVLSFTIAKTSEQMLCMLILALLLVAEMFMQTYLLQGMQYMRPIMLVSVISRTLSTIGIFIFVKDENDLLLYSILYVSTNLITALLGTVIVVKKFKIRFVRLNFTDIKESLKDGWPLFTTSFASKVCSGFAITALGFFCTDAIIGGYSAVQKIPYILVMMFAPIGQAIYPFVCRLYADDLNKGVKMLKKIALVVLGVCFVGVLMLIVLRKWLVGFLGDYERYADLIIPLACWLFLSITNNFLGIQTLVARGYQKQYSRCFLISIVILIVLNLAFGYLFGAMGVAFATMLGELSLTVGCLIVIIKNGLFKTSDKELTTEGE